MTRGGGGGGCLPSFQDKFKSSKPQNLIKVKSLDFIAGLLKLEVQSPTCEVRRQKKQLSILVYIH